MSFSQVERATELALEQAKVNAELAQEQLAAVLDVKDPAAAIDLFKSQLENSVKSLTGFAATAFELSQEFHAEATAFAEGHFDQAHAAANKAIQDNLKHAPNHAHFRIKAAMPWVHGGFFMQRKADYAIFFACTWRLFGGQHEQHHFSPHA